MNNAKVSELVGRLLERTRQGEIGWAETGEEEIYQVELDGISLALSRQLASDVQAFNYYIVLKNAAGRRITSIVIFHDQPLWGEVNQLFYEAEEKAMNVDGVIDRLLEHLNSSQYKVY